MPKTCHACTATPRPEPVKDGAGQQKQQQIIDALMRKLGYPGDLHSVQAVNVFGDNWRVNVRRTLDTSRLVPVVRTTDSFFLHGGSVDGVAKKY